MDLFFLIEGENLHLEVFKSHAFAAKPLTQAAVFVKFLPPKSSEELFIMENNKRLIKEGPIYWSKDVTKYFNNDRSKQLAVTTRNLAGSSRIQKAQKKSAIEINPFKLGTTRIDCVREIRVF